MSLATLARKRIDFVHALSSHLELMNTELNDLVLDGYVMISVSDDEATVHQRDHVSPLGIDADAELRAIPATNALLAHFGRFTIATDRYRGTYSGGRVLVTNGSAQTFPSWARGDDGMCAAFFSNEQAGRFVGRGDDVETAMSDLCERIGLVV